MKRLFQIIKSMRVATVIAVWVGWFCGVALADTNYHAFYFQRYLRAPGIPTYSQSTDNWWLSTTNIDYGGTLGDQNYAGPNVISISDPFLIGTNGIADRLEYLVGSESAPAGLIMGLYSNTNLLAATTNAYAGGFFLWNFTSPIASTVVTNGQMVRVAIISDSAFGPIGTSESVLGGHATYMVNDGFYLPTIIDTNALPQYDLPDTIIKVGVHVTPSP